CNNFCSYCIIPYLRGRSRSRAKESVRSEIEGLIGECKEFILTGINLSDYGSKIGPSLTELLLYLKDLPVRIRLGSLEVGVITDHFLEATKKLQCFCPHFHLSLQSGSGKVLKEMNRKYTPEEFRAAVDRIRKYYPLAAITTDVIVGFATETEEDFEESLAFCRQMNFADMHVFPYSPRVGTVAHKLYKPIAKEVMRCRVAKMTAVKGESRARYEEAHIGLTANMLVEERLQNGDCIGYTENYLKCYLSGEATVNTVYPIRYIAKKEDGMEVEII
ncbi:MAG: radical SAM protein, partial [Clostridia bacterium]|nr:radical SAM protein [Clostridia bacterium]